MLSIALPEERVRSLLGSELSLAAVNGPSLCVASGPVEAIARLESKLAADEIEHARVHIDVAAHSSYCLSRSWRVRTLLQAHRLPEAEDPVCVQPYGT